MADDSPRTLALGDHDVQARKSLEEDLAKAKKSANVASVGVRLNSAMNFIERTRKRLATRDAEIAKKEEEVRQLQFQRAEEMASLVAAEARLESLRVPRRRRPTFQHHLQ